MSPGILRSRTARNLRHARTLHGDAHPATWAAYGRAVAAWGNAIRLKPIAPPYGGAGDNLNIACIAGARATSRPGHLNRHMRRHRAV